MSVMTRMVSRYKSQVKRKSLTHKGRSFIRRHPARFTEEQIAYANRKRATPPPEPSVPEPVPST